MSQGDDQTSDWQPLLDRLTADDPRAIDELLSRTAARLLDLTRQMFRRFPRLRRWEQTDDIFQEAAVRLYRALREVHPESPRQYFGLAALQIRRTLLDLARHHFGPEGAARQHQSGVEPASIQPPRHERDSGGAPRTMEEWIQFHEIVEGLPAEEREIVELRYYHGLSYEEIARIAGVSVATAKRRWQSARQLLDRQLRQD